MKILIIACALAISSVRLSGFDASPDIVDLRLVNGNRVQGPLVQETTSSYIVHQTVTTKNGEMSSDRSIAKADVQQGIHVRVEYDQRAATASSDGPEQAELAAWCLDEQMCDAADMHAHKALSQDATNTKAIAVLVALGYVDDHGNWMKAEKYLSAHQLARFDDKVMTIEQRDTLAHLAMQRQSDRIDDEAKQAHVGIITSSIARDQQRIDAQRKEMADTDKRIARDHAAGSAVDSAKKSLDAANARVAKEDGRIIRRSNGRTIHGVASDASIAEQRKAKQDYETATQAGGEAQLDLAAATSHLSALTADVQKSSTDLDALQKLLLVASVEAADAKKKAQASDTQFVEAFAAITPPADLPVQLTEAVPMKANAAGLDQP